MNKIEPADKTTIKIEPAEPEATIPARKTLRSHAKVEAARLEAIAKGIKPLADILARKCLECNDCERAKKLDLTKHIRDVHKVKFKICKECKLIFKVGVFNGHFCEPDRPRPKIEKVKKSPKKSETVTTTENGVTETPVKVTPVKVTPTKPVNINFTNLEF